jgi:ankyrin repeat protein
MDANVIFDIDVIQPKAPRQYSDVKPEYAWEKAAFYGDVGVTEFLLNQGFNPNYVDGVYNNNAIIWTFWGMNEADSLPQQDDDSDWNEKCFNTFKFLLANKRIDINMVNCEGMSAFSYAVQYGRSECVRMLVETGQVIIKESDIACINACQLSPATRRSLDQLVEFQSGKSQLLLALYYNSHEYVRWLLDDEGAIVDEQVWALAQRKYADEDPAEKLPEDIYAELAKLHSESLAAS